MQRYGVKVAVCTSMPDIDMQQCLAGLLEPVEAEQQRAHEAALKVASGQGRAAELRKAEAEWRKFVDAQCAFERAQFSGGTGAWSTLYICVIERKARRVDELTSIAGQ